MSNTRVVSNRELVSQESIQYIRSQDLELKLIEARPNTKMYVYFGEDDVTELCNLVGNERGTEIITDGLGQAQIELYIPSGEYNTGTYEITVTDANDVDLLDDKGSVYGSAVGNFSANGTIEIYQTTEVTIKEVTRTKTIKRDPLAQSFFTFGVENGMFLTSIEVFFRTKDEEIPVRCEIRELVNGYPSKLEPNNSRLVSILSPSEVNTSDDASIPTKFTFNPPLYLESESEFCFVLRSNSNNYNVFTSRMGEESIEDGRSIFEQPYIGSIFKSENNITWTAYQFEDIKFRLNRAKFNVNSTANVELNAQTPSLGVTGEQFRTTNGSSEVVFHSYIDHGLEQGASFHLTGFGSDYSNAVLNGIPYSEFEGEHTVSSVIDSKKLSFNLSSLANKTGTTDNSGIVTAINVIRGGTGYSQYDTIDILGDGTGAEADLVVKNGQIKRVDITNRGYGYSKDPEVRINSSTGSGAALTALTIPSFSASMNKRFTGFTTNLSLIDFKGTSVRSTLNSVVGNYDGGNLTSYSQGQPIEFKTNASYPSIDQHLMVASQYNEQLYLGGQPSTTVNISISSTDDFVSPVIDLGKPALLKPHYSLVSDQGNEDRLSEESSGSIDNISITSNGSGYTATPMIEIDSPDLSDGTQATASVTINGTGQIDSVTIINSGSGYTKIPLIKVVNDPSDTEGSGGSLQASLTKFNSELTPFSGTSKSKYITKKTQLSISSTGIRLFALISSTETSYVDWYIRTSLSSKGENHDDKQWIRLIPNVEVNQSDERGDVLEYQFEVSDLDEFDIYDLKCVMGAAVPTRSPFVKSFRAILTS